MGLSDELSYEAGSFSHCCNPHRFFQSEVLRLISQWWNPGLRGLSNSPVVLPSYLSVSSSLIIFLELFSVLSFGPFFFSFGLGKPVT